jgi:replicative DNA helicase
MAYKDIVSGVHGDEQIDRAILTLKGARERLSKYPLFVEFVPGASTVDVAGRVRMLKARAVRAGYVLGVVFVDYLGLMRVSERYRGNKVAELGETVLDLKRISQDEAVQVVVGAQLSRKVEDRDDKRPQISDLRDSGNIEEHSDWVGLVYRPAYYIEQSSKWVSGADAELLAKWEDVKNDMDVMVPKARVGVPGRAQLFSDVACSFVGDRTRYG